MSAEDLASLATMRALFDGLAIPDMHEAQRIADCEAFAMRERWNANQRKYFARKDAANGR